MDSSGKILGVFDGTHPKVTSGNRNLQKIYLDNFRMWSKKIEIFLRREYWKIELEKFSKNPQKVLKNCDISWGNSGKNLVFEEMPPR